MTEQCKIFEVLLINLKNPNFCSKKSYIEQKNEKFKLSPSEERKGTRVGGRTFYSMDTF